MNIIEKKYVAVRSKETAKQMFDCIENADLLAYDTETNGLNPRTSIIIGFSVSSKPGEGYYLPTKVYNTETDSLDDLYIDGKKAENLARLMVKSLVGKKLCMHNGVFDCEVTKNYYGVSLIESLHIETLVLTHTLAEDGAFGYGSPFALKSIAQWLQTEIGLDAEKDANEEQIALKESIKKNGGSVTKTNMEFYKADLDILCTYGAADTDLTIRIVNYFLPKLKEEGLWDFFFEEEVMPVYRQLTYPLETRGVRVNVSHLESLREDISKDIELYSSKVLDSLMSTKHGQFWVVSKATEKFPFKTWDEEKQEFKIKKAGKNAQAVIDKYFELKGEQCPLPRHPKKPDQWHSIKANVNKHFKENHPELYAFLAEGDMEPLEILDENFFTHCSLSLWEEYNGGYIKISSKKQLGEIVFDYMGEQPLSYTDKGSPQFNDDFIDSIKNKYKWANDVYIFNRLSKIKSGYFDRIYDSLEDGKYYFNYKQHGTISGRYGSDAQQFPRPMEQGDDEPIVIKYSNEVRALFIPNKGHIFIDCDYESLEPHIFSSVANDEGLKDIFRNKHDFYSTIAIATEGLSGVSADKKADNYLKKVDPSKRQRAKAYCLDGNTKVKNRDGSAILKRIEVGDFVLTSSGYYNKVTNTFKRKAKTCLIKTDISDIRCTLDHKFYVGGNWIEAKDLTPGCYFKSYYNSNKNPRLNEIVLDELEIEVYDITVEKEHNFYANGILVHNCLGIPYGMRAFALSKSLDVSVKEAQSLIDQYLDAYPGLKKWMEWSNNFAIENGYIKSKVGRIRHLNNLKRVCDAFGDMAEQLMDYNFRKELSRRYPEDKVMSAYRDYKNGLNNAKNFQIQSLAASVVNRAGLGVLREFKKEGIQGYPVAQIHDQWIFGVPKKQKQRASEIVQYVMENETDVGIALKAPPEFAYNWRDGH